MEFTEKHKENIKKNHVGMRGKKQSTESNKKRSEKLKGKKRPKEVGEKISVVLTGRKLSETHIENMSKGLKDRKLSNDHKKNIGNGNRGKKLSEKSCKNISDGLKGIKKSKKHCEKISKAKKGIKFTDDHCKKIRISTIKYIESCTGQLYPRYNKNGCKFFNWFNEKFNLKGLHAENIGEYHIKELGYFVDFYEPNLNLVIEFDEKNHYHSDGTLKEKDIIRQKEIIDFLGCDFYRIEENNIENSIENIFNFIFKKYQHKYNISKVIK